MVQVLDNLRHSAIYAGQYSFVMRKAKSKNGFEPRVCKMCGLEFEWRKKWSRDWDSVKYCSEKCKKQK